MSTNFLFQLFSYQAGRFKYFTDYIRHEEALKSELRSIGSTSTAVPTMSLVLSPAAGTSEDGSILSRLMENALKVSIGSVGSILIACTFKCWRNQCTCKVSNPSPVVETKNKFFLQGELVQTKAPTTSS